MCPHLANNLGRPAVVQGRLSLNVCLRLHSLTALKLGFKIRSSVNSLDLWFSMVHTAESNN
jgi:hypothetical protein